MTEKRPRATLDALSSSGIWIRRIRIRCRHSTDRERSGWIQRIRCARSGCSGEWAASAYAFHADIAEKGSGRWSHWRGGVYFSASDNSDPRSNGRGTNWRNSCRSQCACVLRSIPEGTKCCRDKPISSASPPTTTTRPLQSCVTERSSPRRRRSASPGLRATRIPAPCGEFLPCAGRRDREEVDHVVFYENPLVKFERLTDHLSPHRPEEPP